jgi:hypothetical protein
MTNIKDKLRETPAFQNLGAIENPAGFSAPCSAIFNKASFDKRIMCYPNHEYDLGPLPEQFHPTFLKAVDTHRADFGNRKRTCWVHFNQGILAPNETFRLSALHFDAWPGTYPHTDYPNNDVFIVSDNLPTQFSLQTYNLPENIEATDMALNIKIIAALESQVDESAIVTPAAYDLARCDSFTVHRAQIPKVETPRTFLMVRFF